MHFKKSIISILVVTLFLLATIGFISTYLTQKYIDSLTLIEMPVDLSQDETYSKEFTVSSEGRYFIWLVFDREIKNNELACKVGMDPNYYNCDDVDPLLDVTWEILNDSGVVEKGSSSDYPWADAGSELQRTLAKVNIPLGEYVFNIYTNKEASELNSLNPTLRVGAHPLDYQSDLIKGYISLIFSIVSLIIGLSILGLTFFKKRKQ